MPEEATDQDTERGPGQIPGHVAPADEGIPPAIPVDYFAAVQTEKITLPDGVQWVEIKALTEGDRMEYQNKTNQAVKLEKGTGNASIKMAPGEERRVLLEMAIVDWYVLKEGKPLTFSKGTRGSTLSQFLNAAPPAVIDPIEKSIRLTNSWLLADMTVEEIEVEIGNLEEMKAKLIEKEASGNI